jgi:hypothetical protein
VQARLAAARRSSLIVRRLSQGLLAGATGLGLWLLAPQIDRLGTLLPSFPTSGLTHWAEAWLASPPLAIRDLLAEAIDLETGLVSSLGMEAVLAAALLVLPALWGALSLLKGQPWQEGGTP